MKDRNFLIWLHERLEHVHGEDRAVDYMWKLRAIISDMDPEKETPNDGRGKNSIEELCAELNTRGVFCRDCS